MSSKHLIFIRERLLSEVSSKYDFSINLKIKDFVKLKKIYRHTRIMQNITLIIHGKNKHLSEKVLNTCYDNSTFVYNFYTVHM